MSNDHITARSNLEPYNANWIEAEKRMLDPADEVIENMSRVERLNHKYKKWVNKQIGITTGTQSLRVEPTNIDHITGKEDNVEGMFFFSGPNTFHMTTEDIGRAAAFGLQHDYVTGAKWDTQNKFWDKYEEDDIPATHRPWKKEAEEHGFKTTDLGFNKWEDFKQDHINNRVMEWDADGVFDENGLYRQNVFVQKQLDAINAVLNYQVTKDMDKKTKRKLKHHMRDIMKHGEIYFNNFSDTMMRAMQTSVLSGEKLRYFHYLGDTPLDNQSPNSFFDDHWHAVGMVAPHL